MPSVSDRFFVSSIARSLTTTGLIHDCQAEPLSHPEPGRRSGARSLSYQGSGYPPKCRWRSPLIPLEWAGGVEPCHAAILSDSDFQGDPNGLVLAPKGPVSPLDFKQTRRRPRSNSLASILVKSPSDLNQLTR